MAEFRAFWFRYATALRCIRRGVQVIGTTPRTHGWELALSDHSVIRAKRVVWCVGKFGVPRTLGFTFGLDRAQGPGASVLIIGAGNTAFETALECLARGSSVALALRSCPVVLPTRIVGVPVEFFASCYEYVPSWIMDAALVGLSYACGTSIRSCVPAQCPSRLPSSNQRSIVLDFGISARIRNRSIRIFPPVVSVCKMSGNVTFTNGEQLMVTEVKECLGYAPVACTVPSSGNGFHHCGTTRTYAIPFNGIRHEITELLRTLRREFPSYG